MTSGLYLLLAVALMPLPLQAAGSQSQTDTQNKRATTRRNKENKDAQLFRIFNPDTIAKPTGYSHVTEVRGGKIGYIAGQVVLDRAQHLVRKDNLRAPSEQVF